MPLGCNIYIAAGVSRGLSRVTLWGGGTNGIEESFGQFDKCFIYLFQYQEYIQLIEHTKKCQDAR